MKFFKFQLAKKQIGKIKVVKIIKNNDIPSTPSRISCRWKLVPHICEPINWNCGSVLLKFINNKTERTNENNELFRAIIFDELLEIGKSNINILPNKGAIIIIKSMLFKFKVKFIILFTTNFF